MTLDQIIQQCARNTYNQKVMIRSGAGYTGKGLEYAERFLDFINTIMHKTARERWAPSTEEVVTLDENGEFDTATLTDVCIRVKRVRRDQYDYPFSLDLLGVITVDGIKEIDVTVAYDYIPPKMTIAELDSTIPFPEHVVAASVIYNYATFMFLYQEGTDYDTTRATPFLNTFNEEYSRVHSPSFQRRVQ